ncbi:MAG: radical SAM protein [candidate division WOR-3 bacterium]|nr:MAG: radical SAM protein [candidate division WOR-3 bacterium]
MSTEALTVPDLTVPPTGLSRAPRELSLCVTGRCNLKCRYCFYADEMTGRSDLPTERWLALFDELGGLGAQRVTLSGGEAFLREDLFELIDGIIANRMRYAILTNGTLVSQDTVEAFDEGKRRLRLNYVQVSIDGSRAEVHDQSRPPKSFDRALSGLRMLKQAGLPVTVRVTVNRTNLDDLPNIARLLIEDVGLDGFGTNEVEQMGSARCYGESVVLTPAERLRAMDILTELNEQYEGRINAQAGPLAMARHFAKIEESLAQGKNGLPGRGMLNSCGGCLTKMAVLHDGTMVPCDLLPTLTMGVIGLHSLAEAWRSSPAINAVRYRRKIPLTSLPTCHDCTYAGFCSGGCPGSVMAKYELLNARDPLVCYRIFKGEEPGDAAV